MNIIDVIEKEYQKGEQYSPAWYIDFFNRYPCILGIEVYNCPQDRYPYDRILWDEILTATMPQRPVWGFSNDDMHGSDELMGNYNYMLMEELNINALKKAMKQGNFYISNEPGKSGKDLAPHILSIDVDYSKQTITIHSKDCQQIKWISGITQKGKKKANQIVAEGATLK